LPTRLRKVRKFRGSRHHGWGQTAHHAGAGSHGGFGEAGGHKHKWTHTVVYEPDRFGKHGFYKKHIAVPTINVGALNQLIEDLLSCGQAAKKEEGIFVDLSAIGVEKLLGSGKVDKQLIIRVKGASSKAAEKVQEAKGQILTVE